MRLVAAPVERPMEAKAVVGLVKKPRVVLGTRLGAGARGGRSAAIELQAGQTRGRHRDFAARAAVNDRGDAAFRVDQRSAGIARLGVEGGEHGVRQERQRRTAIELLDLDDLTARSPVGATDEQERRTGPGQVVRYRK